MRTSSSTLTGVSGVQKGKVAATPVVHPFLYQHNQTDYDFVRSRAEENGSC